MSGRSGGRWLSKPAKEDKAWSPPAGFSDRELRELYRYRNELCSRCERGWDDTGPLIVPYWAQGTTRETECLLCTDCCHTVADIHDRADSWPEPRNPHQAA